MSMLYRKSSSTVSAIGRTTWWGSMVSSGLIGSVHGGSSVTATDTGIWNTSRLRIAFKELHCELSLHTSILRRWELFIQTEVCTWSARKERNYSSRCSTSPSHRIAIMSQSVPLTFSSLLYPRSSSCFLPMSRQFTGYSSYEPS